MSYGENVKQSPMYLDKDGQWKLRPNNPLDITIKTSLILGTELSLSVSEILEHMTETQISKMFDGNIDAQYILLDYGHRKENA